MKKFIFVILFLAGSFIGVAKGQTANSNQQTDEDKIYKTSEVDKKAKITKRPHPKAGGCKGTSTVAVKVVLRKSGKITDVELFRPSTCQNYNERAIDILKKWKFKPAIKDGAFVSTSIVIEFMYRIY